MTSGCLLARLPTRRPTPGTAILPSSFSLLLLLFGLRLLGRLARPDLFFVFRLDERFQIVEAGGPELAVLVQPGIDRLERLRIQVIHAMPPFSALLNQV